MTAGPPTEPPILTAERILDWRADRDALRARLRDAEETLRYYARTEGHPVSGAKGWDSGQIARAYFERHADPQEPA